MVPQYVHALILRTYEYVSLQGKRDFADMIRDLEMGSLWRIIRWAQCNHRCFVKKRRGESFANTLPVALKIEKGASRKPRNVGGPEKLDPSLELQEGMQSCQPP